MSKRRRRSTFRRRQNVKMVNAAVVARRGIESDLRSGKRWLVERAKRMLGRP